tara:strand:- start:1900 stop:4146 length:2247 start_codon:yes stop_codon:yes gene_type:complete
MWLKILLIFIFFNLNISSAFSKIKNNYNPKIIDNNKEYCKTNNYKFTDNKILLDEVNHISIDIDDQRKWFKNIFKAIIWHGINTPKKFRKNFKAKIKVNFKENLECVFKAKVRIHGDGKDHIQTTKNGEPYASLHVRLIDENIDSIIKFILFIPLTRNYDNEVFTSTLFKELGFLAPRTKYINTYINGVNVKYIFQEKIVKEMIEDNDYPEGPIVEANHRFLWPNERINFMDENLVEARVTNQKWSIKNTQNIKKTTLALSKFNESYIDNKYHNFNTNRLAYKNKEAQNMLNEYNAITSALGGFHGLSPRNTKYYYDPINLTFLPIYYDGNVNILTNNPNNTDYNNPNNKFSYHTKAGATSSIKKIKKIDLDKLLEQLINNGLDLNKEKLILVQQKLIERLRNIQKLNKKEKKFRSVKAYYSKYIERNTDKRLVFFDNDFNEIKVCKFEKNKCVNEHLSMRELSLLFSGKLIKNDKFYIFVSNNYHNYLNGTFLDNSKVIENNFYKILVDNTEIIYNKGIKVIKDDEIKKINFIQEEPSQVVLFKNGKIKDWEINFSGKKIESDITKKGLFSGCINFFNVEFLNVDMNIQNTACEDSINFIRSSGSIKNLSVTEAKVDAIDIDFSNFKIDNVTVSKVLNDCIDLSYGNYKIDKINASNCGDKGISVGEKSNFEGNDISIKNSLIGIATKDGSKSKINNLKIKNTELCAATYRKKQEFYGADMIIENFLCDKNEIYSQNGSNLKIINEL